MTAYTVTAANDAFWQTLVVEAPDAAVAFDLFRSYLGNPENRSGEEDECGEYAFNAAEIEEFEPTSRWLGEPSREVQLVSSGGNG
jgi:hypothetical protein